MLRSLHLTLDYPPKSHGGISTAVGAVVQLLSERVGPALVISYDDWRPSQQRENTASVSRNGSVWRVQSVQTAREIAEAEPFESIARVVVHHPLLWEDGQTLAKRLKAPIDFVLHVDLAHVADICHRVLPPHHAALESRIVREADRVLALSKDVATRWALAYPSTAIALTPLLLGRGFQESSPSKPFRILSVGRFDYVKGTDLMAEAMNEVLEQNPECEWWHVGGNPASPKTQRRWARKVEAALSPSVSSRYRWMPWQDGDALGGFYREASLAVVPSRYETFGLVALEALSFGRPVVAFSRGGLVDTLAHDVTGYLTDAVDASSLARVINETVGCLKLNPNRWDAAVKERYLKLEDTAADSWIRAFS